MAGRFDRGIANCGRQSGHLGQRLQVVVVSGFPEGPDRADAHQQDETDHEAVFDRRRS